MKPASLRVRTVHFAWGLFLLLVLPSCGSPDGSDLDEAQEDLAAGTYNFGAVVSPGKCLDVNGAGTASGTNVQEWTCNGSRAQVWRVQSLAGGLSTLVNPNSGKCLDVFGAGTADGTNIQIWTCHGGEAQSFSIQDVGSGNVRLVNPHSGKCVDVAGAGTANGTNVQLWTCNGSNAQRWRPALLGSSTTPPPTTTGFSSILSESQFNSMFPNRNSFYTYAGLSAAVSTLPGFATTGDTATRKREVAALLANAAHETTGLIFITEIARPVLCGGGACGCASGQSYYGRGPLQLSWSFNYCSAGQALGLNLIGDPGLLERDRVATWKGSLWFWMRSTGAGSRTCHDAMVSGAGFGETIRTINGSLECNGANPGSVQDRVNAYLRFVQILGVSAGPGPTGC